MWPSIFSQRLRQFGTQRIIFQQRPYRTPQPFWLLSLFFAQLLYGALLGQYGRVFDVPAQLLGRHQDTGDLLQGEFSQVGGATPCDHNIGRPTVTVEISYESVYKDSLARCAEQ
jgi:hypothetical protein